MRALTQRLDTAPPGPGRRRAAARGDAENACSGSRSRPPRSGCGSRGAVEALRRDLDTEPEVAEAAETAGAARGHQPPPARARDLERELRLLGPINPLALEEFTALQERHAFLEQQLEDVRTTRRELVRIIKAVDAEIQTVFAAAFADVAANFTELFATLFPGGTGRLVLTNPDDLLTTGIEVEAKPSGKNVKKLSLLSGGERSLTALAYLFAVFRSRPSPFYVMDEVEAALDDVNLHRFLGLVAGVPQRGPAAHRQPSEADHGGRRLPARCHHAAGRLVEGDRRAGVALARDAGRLASISESSTRTPVLHRLSSVFASSDDESPGRIGVRS